MSAGAIVLPGHASSVDQALARAEEALLSAKQKLRNNHVVYTPSREREKTRLQNINVADELITALNDRRIRIAYQPIVDVTTGEAMMHECLVRMERPDGTLVSAGHFVPVAEKLGLIGLLDFRVMELAIETLRLPFMRQPSLPNLSRRSGNSAVRSPSTISAPDIPPSGT